MCRVGTGGGFPTHKADPVPGPKVRASKVGIDDSYYSSASTSYDSDLSTNSYV